MDLFLLFNRQQRVIAGGDITPFLPLNRDVPKGTILGPTLFSVMLNVIQTVVSDRFTSVNFVDDLTLSVLVNGIQDQAPLEVKHTSLIKFLTSVPF